MRFARLVGCVQPVVGLQAALPHDEGVIKRATARKEERDVGGKLEVLLELGEAPPELSGPQVKV